MEIKNIINKGEILNPEQLTAITGGTGAMGNLNLADLCTCKGTGDNTNKLDKCHCEGDAPKPFENTSKACGGVPEIPLNNNKNCYD